MAHLTIRNRDNGHTIETQEFAAEERLALYETYMPGARIVCQQTRWHVHTTAWNRTTQEFVVGVSFEAHEAPAPEDMWC